MVFAIFFYSIFSLLIIIIKQKRTFAQSVGFRICWLYLSQRWGGPRYDTKLHLMMKLQFWGMWSTPSMPLLLGILSPGLVIPVMIQSMDQIDLFENYSYSIGILNCKLFVLKILTWSYNCKGLLFGLVYGISTSVGYLMPKPAYIYIICKHKSTKINGSKYCYVSLTIQLNISHLFTHRSNSFISNNSI